MQVDGQFMTVRVFFSKTSRAKYVSHLDAMRAVTRAIRRSGLPVWHTQGFNPHIYITFALPISLGYEGARESFDIRLIRETDYTEIGEKLKKALPPGFDVIQAAAPVMEPSRIKWAEYDIRLIYCEGECLPAWEKLEVFNRQPMIEAVKKSKKGDSVINIRPHVANLSQAYSGNAVEMLLRCASGADMSINPSLYLKAFYSWSGLTPEGVRIKRTAILDENLVDFC